jgi:hypothetical protein
MLTASCYVVTVLCMVLSLSSRASAASEFLSGISDLPLMAGLTEIPGAGLVFDTPQGRIVSSAAKGPVGRAAVLEFYAGALPELGWSSSGSNRFWREGEWLELEVTDRAGEITIRFSLSPAPADGATTTRQQQSKEGD